MNFKFNVGEMVTTLVDLPIVGGGTCPKGTRVRITSRDTIFGVPVYVVQVKTVNDFDGIAHAFENMLTK